MYNITEESINPAVLAAGLSYFNARPDAAGRPVTIIHVANNHKRGYNTEDLNRSVRRGAAPRKRVRVYAHVRALGPRTCRYTNFSMEFGRKLLPPGIDRVTILFDMTNFGPSNMDLGFVRVRHNPESEPRQGWGQADVCGRDGAPKAGLCTPFPAMPPHPRPSQSRPGPGPVLTKPCPES